jgi:hypothetical protein
VERIPCLHKEVYAIIRQEVWPYMKQEERQTRSIYSERHVIKETKEHARLF